MPQCANRYVEATLTSTEGTLMPPRPMPTTSFRLPQELHEAARAKAEQIGMRLSEVLVRLLGGWVDGILPLPKGRTVYELDDEEGPS